MSVIKFNTRFATLQAPNLWDLLALLLIISILATLAWGIRALDVDNLLLPNTHIELDAKYLPSYAIKTVCRMFAGMIASIIFTFIFAPLAAKNKHIEKILIPLIDICESIPVLGMLSITVTVFLNLFPGKILGAELAAIFAIFTSQVWNMTLSLYQSIKTTPSDLLDAAHAFKLKPGQIFWRVEVPFAAPSLIWNTMMSLSAGWFFVVASEAITVANQDILLPGIGSYISVAIMEANFHAILGAIFTMFLVIILYDQFIFRPLLVWAQIFLPDSKSTPEYQSWVFDIFAKAKLLKKLRLNLLTINAPRIPRINYKISISPYLAKILRIAAITLWYSAFFVLLMIGLFHIYQLISTNIPLSEIFHVLALGGFTAVKIMILIIVASLVWIPLGVIIGLNKTARNIIQPISQFLAAFPVNLIYPIFVTLILRYNLNVEVWTTPLMILGTQWYILFNIIAGAAAIPNSLLLAVKSFKANSWLKWKHLLLPSIFPYYITGAMTTVAGCWNASIVAEVISWGPVTLKATGLGAYIANNTAIGDFPRTALGIAIMCFYVILVNRVVWHHLYNIAANRFSLEQ